MLTVEIFMITNNGLKVLSYWNLNLYESISAGYGASLKVLSYWNLNQIKN